MIPYDRDRRNKHTLYRATNTHEKSRNKTHKDNPFTSAYDRADDARTLVLLEVIRFNIDRSALMSSAKTF